MSETPGADEGAKAGDAAMADDVVETRHVLMYVHEPSRLGQSADIATFIHAPGRLVQA